jgi:UrcA family protein
MIKTVLFAAAAALATVATSAPVLAKDVVVRYGDLDLATAKGQKAFTHRINRAAKIACEMRDGQGLPSHDAMTCYRQARTKAHAEMAMRLRNDRLGG